MSGASRVRLEIHYKYYSKSDTKKQLEKRPKRSIKSRVFGTFIVLVIDNNKSTKT